MPGHPQVETPPAGVVNPMQVIRPGTTVKQAATASSIATVVLGAVMVRLISDIDCYVLFGPTPTATDASMRLVADVPEFFALLATDKIAVLREGGSDGNLWITPAVTV